jgi:L-seryl-tRNA(Ser) seleniumtransferase
MNDSLTQQADGNPLRHVPSVDAVLQQRTVCELTDQYGRARITDWVRRALVEMRHDLAAVETVTREALMLEIEQRLASRADREATARLGAVINGTGVILHTNLGRAPLAEAAIEAVQDASRYANVELDLASGARGQRGAQVEELWRQLTGAEAALVVNNCAAATLLVLQTLAAGREVVISRGQLIEIGGSYRLPDVFTASGAVLREVGTTNRTRLSDYEAAVTDETAALLRVHHSNYRISGFTQDVPIGPLAGLAHTRGLVAIDDLGSGCLYDLTAYGLTGEPVVAESLRAGADLVLFSGDKLLGGPQAGMILGRRTLIDRIGANPLTRALRVDKLTLAAMQATLEVHLAGRAFQEVPALRIIATPADDIRTRVDRLAAAHRESGSQLASRPVPVQSTIGGGSFPDQTIDSWALALTVPSPDDLAVRLRQSRPPILSRIESNSVLLDLRTVLPDQDTVLTEQLTSL